MGGKICKICSKLESEVSFDPTRSVCKSCHYQARKLKANLARSSLPDELLCRHCNTMKPRDDFVDSPTSSTGKKSRCGSCRSTQYQNLPVDVRKKKVEAVREYKALYPEKVKLVQDRCRERPDAKRKRLERQKRYSDTNKEKLSEKNRSYRKRHKSKMSAKSSARRASKLLATPQWADQQKILEFYAASQLLSMLTGEWFNVDHIVPLVSDKVCGLHCEYNLRVITRDENLRKGNRYWDDMPD